MRRARTGCGRDDRPHWKDVLSTNRELSAKFAKHVDGAKTEEEHGSQPCGLGLFVGLDEQLFHG